MSMNTVYKYNLNEDGYLDLFLNDPKVVHYGFQGDSGDFGTVWIEFSTATEPPYEDPEPNTQIEFQVYGTGRLIPLGWEHVASQVNGSFVWHLYQRVTAI